MGLGVLWGQKGIDVELCKRDVTNEGRTKKGKKKERVKNLRQGRGGKRKG